MKKLIYLVAILFLFGCAGDDDEDSSPPNVSGDTPVETQFIGQNNIAALDGALIGTGLNANADLYKNVSILLKNASPYLPSQSSIESGSIDYIGLDRFLPQAEQVS